MRPKMASLIGLVFCTLAGCAPDDAPTAPAASALGPSSESAQSRGFERPPFDLEIILRGDGFGLVKFRQPDDGLRTVHLDTQLRHLTPNTSYALQRAVDANVNGECTSSKWLTLGKGAMAQTITTDSRGSGREELFRNLSANPVGAKFDIHFRVIDATTSAVVLTSDCYQFTVR